MNIYLASSWRNSYQPYVLAMLREAGFDVFDFRHPIEGDNGFYWTDVHPDWREWTAQEMFDGLRHPVAEKGFRNDMDALIACDTCVLLLPAGRSAALELGWAAGNGKRTAVLVLEEQEPELMLKMADFLTNDVDKLIVWLREGEQ